MPNQAQNGYAFEYSIIKSIPIALNKWAKKNQGGTCCYHLIEDAAFVNARNKFEMTDPSLQNIMLTAAKAGVNKILDMEPRLTHATLEDPIEISSSPSSNGIIGDVRDIVMIRQLANSRRRIISNDNSTQEDHWEIGISAKWNNDVIKNSRLAEHLDFCQSWFGFPCSEDYWNEIKIPMKYIKEHIGAPWRSLPHKREQVYLPIITAFINEMDRQCSIHKDIPELLVSYLIGKFDFYKLIAHKDQRVTNVQAFNLRGNLNQDCEGSIPLIRISSQANQRPTRIVSIGRYRDRDNWVEIILDNGWQFTMRLHNAETNIVPSLKFDIRFAGSPFNTWSENW